MYRIKPKRVDKRPDHPVLGPLFDISNNHVLEVVSCCLVVLNTVALAVEYFGEQDELQNFEYCINIICSCFFTMEFVLRLSTSQWAYFSVL